MNFDTMTLVSALAGGMIIGLAATLMLGLLGRVAGISGIVGTLLLWLPGEKLWRILFVLGLLSGGYLLLQFHPAAFDSLPTQASPALLLAGLLVGLGARLAHGCTSGHGVVGLSLFSLRSLYATLTFMLTAMLTTAITHHLNGG
ncbi:MAG: hypothetical protein RIQ52_526 [Pseudomonadota bacterium]|jgi:uncharacterized membrane protein YedE/YeeE